MKNLKYEIKYNNEIIPYKLIRKKIKNLYIYIKNGSVIVKAPTRLKDKYINEFLEKKSKWIYEKVKQNQEEPKEEIISQEEFKKLEIIVQNNIQKYSKLLKQAPNKVRIKNIKYAWGSCSSNRNITINMKLAKKEEKVIEYVVLHEMCHLKHMNHSKEFWDLVETYMPKYKEYKKMLRI